jgi:hypothetical protein
MAKSLPVKPSGSLYQEKEAIMTTLIVRCFKNKLMENYYKHLQNCTQGKNVIGNGYCTVSHKREIGALFNKTKKEVIEIMKDSNIPYIILP